MSSEGQFTAFTRAIVEYFIITTFTGAVCLFTWNDGEEWQREQMTALNTGTGDEAKYSSLANNSSDSVTETRDSSSAPHSRRPDARYTRAKA